MSGPHAGRRGGLEMRGRNDQKILFCLGCEEPFPENALDSEGLCEECREENEPEVNSDLDNDEGDAA